LDELKQAGFLIVHSGRKARRINRYILTWPIEAAGTVIPFCDRVQGDPHSNRSARPRPSAGGPFEMKPGPRTPEARQRISGALVAYWADPDKRARHGQLIRERMARPEVRERISSATKSAYNVPGMRERKLAGLQRAFADPDLRRRISEATKAGMAAKAERQRAALVDAWKAAPKAVRERFLCQIAAVLATAATSE
jgi:hypothetical protein